MRKVEGGEDALIVLRLFYRCLEAWLLVADDTELHGGEVFALGELRAIASTMNCLVCNAYLMGGGGGGGESDRALLHGLSGCCARLFDRDASGGTAVAMCRAALLLISCGGGKPGGDGEARRVIDCRHHLPCAPHRLDLTACAAIFCSWRC